MRSFHLINELAKHHEVDVLAFNQSKLLGSYFQTVNEGIIAAKAHFEQTCGSFEVFPIPSELEKWGRTRLAIRSLFTSDPYTINWLKSNTFQTALHTAMTAKKYDLIHFDTISLAPFINIVTKAKCILDHHNIESHMLLRRVANEPNIFKRIYFWQEGKRLRKYEQSNLKKFSLHIVCSKDDKKRLLDLDQTLHVEVVPNGISMDDADFERKPSKEAKILFIGGLSWYPNAQAMNFFLNEVWPLISAEHPNVSIDIIGRSPPRDIETLSKMDSRIKVHGYVDNISNFYREATVYICPIMDGGGTKLKVLDALAHRTPLVAHPIACEGLNIIDQLHGLIATTPGEMADAILRLIKDPELAKKLGDSGSELVRTQYEVRAIGEKFSNLLLTL